MTEKYHSYVFDQKKRKLVGDFEQMYKDEKEKNFDSWHERDCRFLRKQIPLLLLSHYNFSKILDLGCGKGTLSQFLKKRNNTVVGVDISPTAIDRAKASFPDINFVCSDISEFVIKEKSKFDLVVIMGTLAYIENYKEVLSHVKNLTKWILVAEYIPDDPIGYVKSIPDLRKAFMENSSIEHEIILDNHHLILFGKSFNENKND